MKKITANEFTANVKRGNDAIIEEYAKQHGVDFQVMENIARQLRLQRNAKLTMRTVNKEGIFKGDKRFNVSFDNRWYTRTLITWCFDENGNCYSVLNGCFCK